MNLAFAMKDPVLQNVINQIERPVILSTEDVFHDVMSCIIEQQIHYRSTKRIFAKALERAGLVQLTTDNFPAFEKHALPYLTLAGGKYETMMSFIEYWTRNTLDFKKLTDEEVTSELSSIKGIGTWTTDMILLYTLNRPNIFPHGDFHLKQVMISLYGLDPRKNLKARMLQVAENWENQSSLAVLYLLAWKNKKP